MRGALAVAAAAVMFVVAACSSAAPAPEPNAEPAFRVTGTVKDIMEGMIDPHADVLWEAVSTTITRDGVQEKRPRTDEEWQAVRRSAVALAEATNLLLVDGRKMAPLGHKSEYPGYELEPEEMEKLVAADRESWVRYAHALHDQVMVVLQAIDAKNVQGLSDAGAQLDEACENCHKHYWYPDEKPS